MIIGNSQQYWKEEIKQYNIPEAGKDWYFDPIPPLYPLIWMDLGTLLYLYNANFDFSFYQITSYILVGKAFNVKKKHSFITLR